MVSVLIQHHTTSTKTRLWWRRKDGKAETDPHCNNKLSAGHGKAEIRVRQMPATTHQHIEPKLYSSVLDHVNWASSFSLDHRILSNETCWLSLLELTEYSGSNFLK